MDRKTYNEQVKKTLSFFEAAHIVLTEEEKSRIEAADFGLGRVDKVGLQLLTYINTDRVCAKEMVLLPGQTCPEHRHVPTNGAPGKEETFRCRYGEVRLYVPGPGRAEDVPGGLPETAVTVFHEIVLHPGEQHTILPGTLHWFRAGNAGAVISEFSTHSTDETDFFTDGDVVREARIEE